MVQRAGSSLHCDVLHLFKSVCDAWGLPTSAQLALLGKRPSSSSTYRGWIRKVNLGLTLHLDRDVVDRIAYVIGTYESSNLVWGSPEGSYRWLTTASHAPQFAGAPPLARMLRGGMEDIRATWDYISSIATGVEVQGKEG